jgi:hypothetical protein
MRDNIFRYRIISNLQCNNRCSFCYQTMKPPLKTDVVLSIDKMEKTLKKVYNKYGKLPRATIMGGESLLVPNLDEYVGILNNYVETICLVTNGKLLTEERLAKLKENGLKELAISVYSMSNYIDMTDITKFSFDIIGDGLRLNIPRCEDSSNEKLRVLVETILNDGYGVVVCEDLMGRYGRPHDEVIPEWKNTKYVGSDGHNFLHYEMGGKIFGLFAHYFGYNETDVIITPLGNFLSWEKYCNAIDNFNLK